MWAATPTNPELAELRAEASASAAHDGFEAPRVHETSWGENLFLRAEPRDCPAFGSGAGEETAAVRGSQRGE